MDKIKALLDELANVTAQIQAAMDAEEAPAGEGEAADPSMAASEESSLRSLCDRADAIKAKIEFLEKVAAKEVELRAVLERGAPAKKIIEKTETPVEAPAVESRKFFAVPKSSRPLKGFRCEERAYRAGMAIKAWLTGDEETRRWCADHGVEYRAQAGGTNSLGGALKSDELSTEILRLVEEYGAFPANAKNVNMTSDVFLFARRTGGLTAKPIGENAAPDSTNVTFDNVTLTAKMWAIDNRIPNSLLEDSAINLADAMAVEVAQAYAEAFDTAGFIGDGSATYHGTTGVAVAIVDGTHTKSVVTAATGNNTFDTLDLSDFTNAVARLPVYARRNARWYISPAGYGSGMLRLMTAASGNNVADVAGGAGLQFLGFPVVLCHPLESELTSTGGKVSCLFGDLSQAAIMGTRREVRIATDSSRFIEYDQLLTFATSRVSMVAADLGSTSKAGPIVALKFAA